MDQFGNVYIADSQNDRIIKKAAGTGIITVVAGGNGRGNSLNQLNFPVMVHVDAMGWIYVSDMNNHRIMKWIEGRSQGLLLLVVTGLAQDFINSTTLTEFGLMNKDA